MTTPIEIELGGTYVAPYWSTPDQLRTSAALLVAVVRRLEGLDQAMIGARELVNPGADVHDLEHLRPYELELISDREIQDAVVLIDGVASRYRLTVVSQDVVPIQATDWWIVAK